MKKPRVIKDYEKINDDLIAQIKLNYPRGFEKHLVTFKGSNGEFISALPFETKDRYYLIRMTKAKAQEIIEEDKDYDDGVLKVEIMEEYQGQFEDDLDAEDIVEEVEE